MTACSSGEDNELNAADTYFGSLFRPRSWPRNNSATGQYQTINEPLLDGERNSIAVLDGAKGHTDDDYEDPELRMAEDRQSVKILPARPIKESEYADTRYFKGMMDTPLSLDSKTSLPTDRQTWMKLEEVEKPISKDIRNQHVKGKLSYPFICRWTSRLLPCHSDCSHRPPVKLPKKYQPLPPEPPSSRPPFPQRHTFPEAQRGASSSFMTRNPTVQNRDHKESMPSYAPQRCQSPAGSGPQENQLLHKITSRRKPFPTRSDGKNVQHNEWYIGEYSRQAVEEALMKENKDGTFLVRDCSAKSRAEPYVLAVFYGNKVYNVKIRFLERNQQFALGTGLRGDEKFDSVEAIIEHYKYFPIILIDGKDKTGTHREQCYLTQALPVNRHFSPR
ncbi:hypothetical protein G4228_004412 [Cervus hanglu yarkandensis]|nr:hypothetical protein G4228_004412 [Cervus hanglu yarkandensis]